MSGLPGDLAVRFDAAKRASREIARLTGQQRTEALLRIADAIDEHTPEVVSANEQDLVRGVASGLTIGLQDRLRLDAERVRALAAAVRDVAAFADPVGEVIGGRRMPNGVRVEQIRVPFGVVAAIYEARPNVTVDIAALALRSGNAVLLRGGSAARESNLVLVQIMRDALADLDITSDAIASVDDHGRSGAQALMAARGIVDVLIPRGSAQLIRTVVTESIVPVIETGAGNVHIFLDETAPLDWAQQIVLNAKTQRPSVCNAMETLLVHGRAAERLLPALGVALDGAGVTLHADEQAAALLPSSVAAVEADWGAEYLDLDLAVRVVDDLDAALEHIRMHSTGHTDAIITTDTRNADRFLAEVDSAVVMVNASTRFTDGSQFGFGAEVGVSTQKLHARGPMGLTELTSTKWLVRGEGQARA